MNKAQKEAQRLKPFLTSNIPARQSTNSSPPNGTGGGGTGVDNTAAINAVAADLALHKLLDYAEGHGPADIYRSKQHTYHSNKFGIVGGTGTDESNNIIAMLNTVGAGGGGVCVISATNYADPVIQIDKTISIYYDNVHVLFDPATRVLMGATGCLRIMGSLDEYTRKLDGTAMKLHIASTVNGSNQTVLEMSATDTALMDAEAVPANRIVVVGDKIVVRGQNDVSGKAIEKDTTFVSALAKVGSYWRITCVDELDYTFQPTYPSSEWPPDLTTGTTIYIVRFGTISADLAAGSVKATVNSISGFAIGDVIQVGDSRTENAYNASALKGDGTPYANPAALELLRIIAFNQTGGETTTIYFDRATTRTYKYGSPYYGGVARTVMVRNSTISGARISYHENQTSTSYNALQMTYAVECEIHHNTVNGYTYVDGHLDGGGQFDHDYGRAAHGLRMSYALNCKAHNNVILDCVRSDSGKGYGITDYYSTGNQIFANVISGCRHSILLQLATNSIIYGNESRNHLISGIDVHGVNSYGFHIYGNTITQANQITTDSTQGSGIRIGNTSHSVGDHFGVIENNVFIYTSGTSDQAFDVIANSSNITFRNNTVENANIGFKFTLNSKQITPVQTATNILVEGNRFIGCTAGCISVTAAPTYDGTNSNGKLDKFFLVNNISDGNDKHFQMTGVVTTLGLSNVIVSGNIVVNPTNVTTTNYGVSVKYTSGYVHIYDNDVSGCQRGITVLGCGTVFVIGNKTASTVQTDPFTDGGGNTSLSYLDAMTAGSGTGELTWQTNTLYVDAAFPPSTYARRYATIIAAMAAASAGTTILVAPGTYTGDVTFSQDGIKLIGAGAPSYNSGTSTFGGGTLIVGAVDINNKKYCQVVDLGVDVHSAVKDAIASGATQALSSVNLYCEVRNVVLAGNGSTSATHGVRMEGGSTNTIHNAKIFNFGHGIALRCSHVNVSNIYTENCGISGIIVKSDTPNGDVYDVNIANTDHYLGLGVIVEGYGSGTTVYSVKAVNVSGRSNTGPLVMTRVTSGTVINVSFTNCHGFANAGDMFITDAGSAIQFVNCVSNGATRGWKNVSGTNVQLVACYSENASVADFVGTFTTELGANNNLVVTGSTALAAFTSTGGIIDGTVRVRQFGTPRYRGDHGVASGTVILNAYDDTGAVYIPLEVDASVVLFKTGTAANKIVTIDANGWVGINTATPVNPLTVDGFARFRQSGSTRYRSDFGVTGGLVTFNGYDDTGAVYIPLYVDNSEFRFRPSGSGSTQTVIDASGNMVVGGRIEATGATTSTALGVDNVRAGVNTGVPVIYLEDASSTVRGIDNNAGTLRFTHPGVVDMTIDTSSNVTATGNFVTANKFVSNVASPSGKIHVEDFGQGYLLAMGVSVSTTPIDVSGNIVSRGMYVVGSVWAVSGTAGAIVQSTFIAPSGTYNIVVGAYTFRISLTSGGKIQVVSQAGGSNWDYTLGFYYL